MWNNINYCLSILKTIDSDSKPKKTMFIVVYKFIFKKKVNIPCAGGNMKKLPWD